MSLRPPRSLAPGRAGTNPFDTLEAELLAEKAMALGRAGEAVEKALAAFRAAEGQADRGALAHAAGKAVHAFFIQRESIGLRDHREAVARYAIPRQVLAKVGVV